MHGLNLWRHCQGCCRNKQLLDSVLGQHLLCRLVALNLTVHGMLVFVLPLIRLMVVMSISNGGQLFAVVKSLIPAPTP